MSKRPSPHDPAPGPVASSLPSHPICWCGYLLFYLTLLFHFYELWCDYGLPTYVFRAVPSGFLSSFPNASLLRSCSDLQRPCMWTAWLLQLSIQAGRSLSYSCSLLPVCTPSITVAKVMLYVHRILFPCPLHEHMERHLTTSRTVSLDSGQYAKKEVQATPQLGF